MINFAPGLFGSLKGFPVKGSCVTDIQELVSVISVRRTFGNVWWSDRRFAGFLVSDRELCQKKGRLRSAKK